MVFTQYHAIAQQSEIHSSKNIANVDVSSNRLLLPFDQNNHDIQIIDKKRIEQLSVNSIAELLSYCNGIDVRQRGPNGTQSDISINGGSFDQTLILINGVKIIDAQTGHHLMNLPIPVQSIERIEILKGAASRRYGINAVTGAINIITKKNIDNNALLVSMSTGTNFKKDTSTNEQYYLSDIGLTSQFKIKNTQHAIGISRTKGNGYRYNTAFENYKFLTQQIFSFKDQSSIQSFASYTNNSFGANSFYSAPADKNSFEKVETFMANVEYKKQIRNLSISPRVNYRYNDDNYIFIKQKPEVYENNHYSHSYSAELNTSYQFKKSVLAFGLEHRLEKLNSNNLGERERNNSGIFIEYRIAFFENKLNINTGVYINHNDLFGAKALPGIDIGYDFLPSLKLYANWGTGQRIPTFTDLYYIGPSNIGNANLIPEQSSSKELGVKFKKSIFSSDINVFERTITNFIDWTKASASDPWMPSNFSSLYTWGWSIHNTINFSTTTKNTNIQHLRLAYTRLNSHSELLDEANFSKYIIDNLKDQLNVELSVQLYKNLHASIQYKYQNRLNYKDYSLCDFNVKYKLNKFNFKLDANNIFDERFEEVASVPMVGRWWGLGLEYRVVSSE